jgi:hypothetical protein
MDNKVLVQVAASIACQIFQNNKQIPSLEAFKSIVTESVVKIEPNYKGLTVSEATIVENSHREFYNIMVYEELIDLSFIIKAINESYNENTTYYALVRLDSYVESANLSPYELIEIGVEINYMGYSVENYDRMYLQLCKHDNGVARPIHEDELTDNIDGYNKVIYQYILDNGYNYADGKADN